MNLLEEEIWVWILVEFAEEAIQNDSEIILGRELTLLQCLFKFGFEQHFTITKPC